MAKQSHQRSLWLNLAAASVWLMLSLVSYTVFAQEALPPPRRPPDAGAPAPVIRAAPLRGLTLAELERMALSGNPTLVQASAGIEQQRGTWMQVGLYPNPQAGYIRSDASRAGQTRGNSVYYAQEIVTAHKRQWSRAVEEQQLRVLSWQRQAQRQRVLNDLRIRYYEVLAAQQAIDISQTLARIAGESIGVAEELLRAKQGTRSDLLQARIQRTTVMVALQDARYRYDAAWRQLADVVGQPQMTPVRLEGRLDTDVPQLGFPESLQRLFAASPQLRAAEAELRHAQSELRRERANRIPNVTVQTVTQFDQANHSTNVNALIAAPLPLYNRNQGNIYHATADIRAAQAEIERVQLVLRDQLSDSFRRYQSSRNQVEQLRDLILPDARENLALVDEGYKQGEFNFVQVLNARQTWFQANLAYGEALGELHKVTVEIDGLQLTGALNPAALGAAIQTTGGLRQTGLLQQLQESSTKQTLPAAVQAITP